VVDEARPAFGISTASARRDVCLCLLVRHTRRPDPLREVRGRPPVGSACRLGPRSPADPRKGMDRPCDAPEARRGSPHRGPAGGRGGPRDSRVAVFRTAVRDGFLSVQDGPRGDALRHLVLRRRDAAEGIRDPGPAMVHRTIVAGSAVRADDRVRARPRRRRRAVAGGENRRGAVGARSRDPRGGRKS